jgi:hypothetical protein
MGKHLPDAEERLRKAYQRLGTNRPACCCCAETYSHCLELHHIPGQASGNELSIVCRNCHRKLTDAQKDRPGLSTPPPSLEERIARFLLGLGQLLELAAKKLIEFGACLLEIAQAHTAQADGPAA